MPYLDPNGGGMVIGCGIRAGKMKRITEHESLMIVEQEVLRLRDKINEAYPGNNFNQRQMTALVSILYNTPVKQDIINSLTLRMAVHSGDKTYMEHFFERQITGVEKYHGVKLGGLRKRRARELDLFFNNTVT